jgi:hypothetical protein
MAAGGRTLTGRGGRAVITWSAWLGLSGLAETTQWIINGQKLFPSLRSSIPHRTFARARGPSLFSAHELARRFLAVCEAVVVLEVS